MWKHILFATVFATSLPVSVISASPADANDSGCTPDSVLFEGNPRAWYPGEPIQWADQNLLDSLIATDPDGFHYFVESPRSKGYIKNIKFLKAPSGKTALFESGDLRYINYNGEGNQSHSVVVAHTYRSLPYWFQDQLHFQNGWANWFKHSQRLYHSKETNEIEMRATAPAPIGAENAVIFSNDTASFFIMITGHLEDATEHPDIYSLAHNSSQWKKLGHLNGSIQRLNGNVHGRSLQDYFIFYAEASYLVLRKSDLKWTVVPSALAQLIGRNSKTRKGGKGNTWFAWKGNTAEFRGPEGKYTEDISKLVQGAEWSPLIVHSPPEPLFKKIIGNLSAWMVFLGLIVCGMAIVLWRFVSKGQMPQIPPANPDVDAPPSSILVALLKHASQQLSCDELDALIGLSEVQSPETRRSRRARIVQLVNTESTARYGQALLVRNRLESDRRVVIYSVQDLSQQQ